MDAALALSALLMGLAGSPHCIAMCGAACSAAVMGAFAVASSVGLWAGPALWWRLNGSGALASSVGAWSVRLAGGCLAAVPVWSLGRDVWPRVVAFCFG